MMSNEGKAGGRDIVAGEQGGSNVVGREKGRSAGSSGSDLRSKSVYNVVRLYVILIVAGLGIVFFDLNTLQPFKDNYLMSNDYSYSTKYNNSNVTDTLLEWVSSPLKHNTNLNNNSSSTKKMMTMTKEKEFTQQKQQQQQEKAVDKSLKEVMMGRKQKKQKEIDDRPYLIFHVGPPKTGTTTIQSGLLQMAQILAEQDNYYFLGQSPHQRVTIEINHNSTNSTTDGNSIHSIKQKNRNNRNKNNTNNYTNLNDKVSIFRVRDFIYSQPHKDFKAAIRNHLKEKQNIIISSEHFSTNFHLTRWNALYKGIFLLNPPIKNNTHNLEPFFGFNVKIVVTYRHFFQWVLSRYHQQHVANIAEQNDTIGIVDYLELYINDLKQYVYNDDDNADHNSNDDDGDDSNANNNDDNASSNDDNENEEELSNSNLKNTSLLTYYTLGMGSRKQKDTIKKQVHGSLWSYLFWSEQTFSQRNELYNRVDVYDMHQQELDTLNSKKNSTSKRSHNTNDMFTNFVCQMIPTATNTCHYLQQQQHQKEDGTGTAADSHYRASRKPNQYLTVQDRFRILQTARSMKNDMNTTTATTIASIAPTVTTNIMNHIQQFNFTGGRQFYAIMVARMEEWFQQHKMNSTSTSTSTNDSNSNNNNNVRNNTALLYDIEQYFLCLEDTKLLQLKGISWNYLVQQILLVNRHNSVVDRRQQQQKQKQNSTTTSFSTSSSLSSLFQSSTAINNLVLSSQFNFNFDDNDNDNIPNNNNTQLFLSLIHPLKKEHDTLFYESVDRRLFCQINPKKMLENEDFVVSIFQNSYY